MSRPAEDNTELLVWRTALNKLLAAGATAVEALEGANLVVIAHRRKQSSTRRRVDVVAEQPADPKVSIKRRT